MATRCIGQLQKHDELYWCEVPVSEHVKWELILPDLLPDQLWNLQRQSDLEMTPLCAVSDGIIVGIEIIEGQRYKHVDYANPGICCPHIQCAVAHHVQQVVSQRVF